MSQSEQVNMRVNPYKKNQTDQSVDYVIVWLSLAPITAN
jgi:hypothetical protein